MRGSRFTVDDALEQLAIIVRPLASVEAHSDQKTIQEHWQAIGALGVILRDMKAWEDSHVRKD